MIPALSPADWITVHSATLLKRLRENRWEHLAASVLCCSAGKSLKSSVRLQCFGPAVDELLLEQLYLDMEPPQKILGPVTTRKNWALPQEKYHSGGKFSRDQVVSVRMKHRAALVEITASFTFKF